MSRCPDCGSKECCGGEMSEKIQTLQASLAAKEKELDKLKENLTEIHIFPCDVEPLLTTECCIEVYSVAAGHPEKGRTISLSEALTTE